MWCCIKALAKGSTENSAEKNLFALLFAEVHRNTVGRKHLPERWNCPARSKDVVVEALAIAAVVPSGVLHNLGIESLLGNVEVMTFVGH